ncbi:MAG: hypothetical protein JW754_02515 [Candidatus Aenigmarchaeota archaeon]|nr:hypothetical protein [Candidatus Aenigmarchaeota archaeon]
MKNEVLEALKKPDSYDEPVSRIDMLQTHISWVFLTGKYVYKMKKPVDFGFLDFSTLEKRKMFCNKELEINRLFSPELYIGVLPVNRFNHGLKINGPGETVEVVIKMKQLPQDRLMDVLLERGQIGSEVIDQIIGILERFYSKTSAFRDPWSQGGIDTVKFNWNENFKQTSKYIGMLLERSEFDEIKSRVERFMREKRDIIQKRQRDGFVKWCHGDLHSGNIFVVDGKIFIFDAIEFNERFAISDIANDIAFLAMDLDFRGKKNLSAYFVNKYIERSGDTDLASLLGFYMCYRAYVRGKVTGFRMDDQNVSKEEKENARRIAKRYFEYAYQYSKEF